ncbi:MAG: nucleotidyltransferase family protein [Thiobacillaceae bacterium]|nr:nucleotidyltransferase family protein [Thiobacillaceae bacterium]
MPFTFQAIVLAGGLGTRLRAVVPQLPKPMAPVAGRPFLEYVLDRLVAAGCAHLVLAVAYRHEAIEAHFGSAYRGVPIVYSLEANPLGTGGAIRQAAQWITAEPVCVVNGDTYVELDYAAMHAAHRAAGASLTVAVCAVDDVGRYGSLTVVDERIVAFAEKGGSGPGLINAGTYLIERNLIEGIPPGRVHSLEQELLVPRVAALRPLAFVCRGRFIDIGVPEDYARAQQLFAEGA